GAALQRSRGRAQSKARRAGSSSGATSAHGRSRTSAVRRPTYSRRTTPLPETAEIGIDTLEILGDRGLAVLAREGAGQEILFDSEVGEATPPLHHLNAAASHQFAWRQGLHFDAVEQDRAFGDLAALRMQQIGDRLSASLSCPHHWRREARQFRPA